MSAALESLVELGDPAAVATEIGRINSLVGSSEEVPEEAWQLVGEVISKLDNLAVHRWSAIDPYLQAVFLRGFAQASKALKERNTQGARRSLRLGLERMRHALEQIAEVSKIGDERNPKELVRWLSENLPVPQQELAELLGVERRKLQRWLQTDGPRPEGDDALRVAVVVRIVNQLRHSFTPVGVLRWFDRPRAELGGKRPRTLLKDPSRVPQLMGLATSVRHSDAA
jgi:uncharacterized protein (DUF2384 family)